MIDVLSISLTPSLVLVPVWYIDLVNLEPAANLSIDPQHEVESKTAVTRGERDWRTAAVAPYPYMAH